MTPACYPALFSNPLHCPRPGILPKPGMAKLGADRSGKHTERLVDFPNLTVSSSALRPVFQRSKSLPATMVHTGSNTALQLPGSIRMLLRPQESHKPPYNAKQGATRSWPAIQVKLAAIVREIPLKNQRLLPQFLERALPPDGERR